MSASWPWPSRCERGLASSKEHRVLATYKCNTAGSMPLFLDQLDVLLQARVTEVQLYCLRLWWGKRDYSKYLPSHKSKYCREYFRFSACKLHEFPRKCQEKPRFLLGPQWYWLQRCYMDGHDYCVLQSVQWNQFDRHLLDKYPGPATRGIFQTTYNKSNYR